MKTRNEWINQYVKWGWSILPVMPGSKRPAVSSWTQYQKTRPTTAELKLWFEDPDMGVGVVTGELSGIVVIDEDSYKAHGTKLELTTPLKVVSGSGGRHLYFKYTAKIANAVNKEKAIDIRGDGGFIVLPPTIHPNGTGYKWDGEVPETLESLPALSSTFVEDVFGKWEPTEKINITEFMNVGSGGRNDNLHRAACSLLNAHPMDEAVQLINAVNQTYDPPLADWEVRTIIESAGKFIASSPKKGMATLKKEHEELDREELEIISFDEAERQYNDLMKKYGDGITTGFEALDEYFKFLPTNLYMFSAATHVGKTNLLLNMAGRMARAGNKVIIASLEQNVFVIPRITSMFNSREGLENISFIAPDMMPTPDDFVKVMEKDMGEKKVLMIDHLHFFARGTKGATESMDELVANIQMVAKKLQIPVVVVAHLRKLNKDNKPTLDDLKDSSSLAQIPGVVCLMHRDFNKEEDIEQKGVGYFSNLGTLFIAKNRVQGKTGLEKFEISDNGEIVFASHPNDIINKKAEITSNAGKNGWDGFFTD